MRSWAQWAARTVLVASGFAVAGGVGAGMTLAGTGPAYAVGIPDGPGGVGGPGGLCGTAAAVLGGPAAGCAAGATSAGATAGGATAGGATAGGATAGGATAGGATAGGATAGGAAARGAAASDGSGLRRRGSGEPAPPSVLSRAAGMSSNSLAALAIGSLLAGSAALRLARGRPAGHARPAPAGNARLVPAGNPGGPDDGPPQKHHPRQAGNGHFGGSSGPTARTSLGCPGAGPSALAAGRRGRRGFRA